jgi:hypothetical protein
MKINELIKRTAGEASAKKLGNISIEWIEVEGK